MDSERKVSKQEVLDALGQLHQTGEISKAEIDQALIVDRAEKNAPISGSATQVALMYVGVILIAIATNFTITTINEDVLNIDRMPLYAVTLSSFIFGLLVHFSNTFRIAQGPLFFLAGALLPVSIAGIGVNTFDISNFNNAIGFGISCLICCFIYAGFRQSAMLVLAVLYGGASLMYAAQNTFVPQFPDANLTEYVSMGIGVCYLLIAPYLNRIDALKVGSIAQTLGTILILFPAMYLGLVWGLEDRFANKIVWQFLAPGFCFIAIIVGSKAAHRGVLYTGICSITLYFFLKVIGAPSRNFADILVTLIAGIVFLLLGVVMTRNSNKQKSME